jgi:molybdopterin-guanine dinucleotide biosynthesis protein A
VVLCGGASRRMGRDKALLPLDDGPLIQRALASLAPLGCECLLACGPQPRHAELGLPLVLDEVPGVGPLAGLAAALAAASTERVLVLACDLPRASAAVNRRLLDRAEQADLDVCCVGTPAGLEPLYGVYHRRCLPAVRAALARGERRMIAFHAGLAVGRLELDELPAAERGCAVNLNTPADYEAERAR